MGARLDALVLRVQQSYGNELSTNYTGDPEIKQWIQDCYLFPPHETDDWSTSNGTEPELLKDSSEKKEMSYISLK